MHQCVNASMHQWVNASVHQRINASMHQCINTSMDQIARSVSHASGCPCADACAFFWGGGCENKDDVVSIEVNGLANVSQWKFVWRPYIWIQRSKLYIFCSADKIWIFNFLHESSHTSLASHHSKNREATFGNTSSTSVIQTVKQHLACPQPWKNI